VVTSGPRWVRSSGNCTPATPTLSAALAETEIVPETVVPVAGAVIETVGGVVSGTGLLTVTVTVAVLLLPAASRAMALSVCEALLAVVVFQLTLYGEAVSSAPRVTPSNRNCTPTTPLLSEALAETEIVPSTVAAFAGAVIDTVGGVVSTGGVLLTVTETAADVVLLPAPSRAIAVSVCAPFVAVVVSQETL